MKCSPDPTTAAPLALALRACEQFERVASEVVALRLDGAERERAERLLAEARALAIEANSGGAE